MGKACTVSDSTIDDIHQACPGLGSAPPHKRKDMYLRPAMTHNEIAKELGITKQAVSAIEKRALTKLWRQLNRPE